MSQICQFRALHTARPW